MTTIARGTTGRRTWGIAAALVAAMMAVPTLAYAAAGDLDSTFGGSGMVFASMGGDQNANAVAVQPDGMVVLAGGPDVMRYNANGSVDSSFDGDGLVALSINAVDLALQADGKIVIAGGDWTLIRLLSDGSVDTSFDTDGLAAIGFDGSATRLAIQPNGKIVVGGSIPTGYCSDTAVARVNSDGSLDTTFDGDGKTTTDYFGGCDGASDVAVQTDGRIVVVGSIGSGFSPTDVAVTRFNVDGSLDTSFDGDGGAIAGAGPAGETGNAIAVQADGKIVTAGSVGGDILLVRFNSDGSLDTSFGAAGLAVNGFANLTDVPLGVAVQSDGRIVTGGILFSSGYPLYVEVTRFNSDGSPDVSFAGTGLQAIYLAPAWNRGHDVALAPDGKIVVGGDHFYDGNGTWAMLAVRLDPGPLTPPDTDEDGVNDSSDNCPLFANADQANTDGDSEGDACDADDDNDGVNDGSDNCPLMDNTDQANYDGDTAGDHCDPDDDNDGVADGADLYPMGSMAPTVIIGTCDSGVPNTVLLNGSSLNDLIGQCASDNPSNHGRFVSCVSNLTTEWSKQKLITGDQSGAIMRCTN